MGKTTKSTLDKVKFGKEPKNNPTKFEELSAGRMERAIKAIDLIGNLSAPSYEWKQNDVEKMLGRLHGHIYGVRARFERTRRWKKNDN